MVRLYVFISCYRQMLMFCSLYVFDPFQDSSTLPFQPFFLLGSMYFFMLFDQVTYLAYTVGKSTPFSIISESLILENFPIFRGYALFFAVTAHPIFIFKTYREIQTYPDSNEPISLQNVKFCRCIYLLYFFLFTIYIHSS